MTKHDAPQQQIWTESQQTAFDEFKRRLCEAPILRTPDWNRPSILHTDASNLAAAVYISQEFITESNEVKEHPLAFASCKFTDSQIKWSTIKKEAYAILFGFKTFDYFLFDSHITVYTDHNSLKYLTLNAPNNARLTRWVLVMQRYTFEVKHIKGEGNRVCDI